MVGARVYKYRPRDGMIYCKGSICSALEFTLREMIMGELHHTPSTGDYKALYELEVQWMADLSCRRMFTLQAVSGYVIRRQGNGFRDVFW